MNKIKLISLFLLLYTLSTTSLAFCEDAFPLLLKNSDGKEVSFTPKDEEITVLEWFNKGCPFIQKFYNSGFMQSLQEKYTAKGIKWFTINSTREDHDDFIKSEDRPALKSEFKFKSTDLVYDESGEYGKKVGAKTTPHVFIYKGKDLLYSGAVDDAPDSDTDPKMAHNNIEESLTAILKGEKPVVNKTRPYGCSVKYK